MDRNTAELAHDLKMPIQLIYSCVQLLEMEIRPDSSARSYLNLLMQSAQQLQMMVVNALDGEQLCEGKAQLRLSPRDIVAEARSICRQCELTARDKSIEFGFHTNVAEFRMMTDGEKLGRILLNLISNALKFTPEKGSIEVFLTARGDAVEFEVRDTGCGMNAEQLEHIFERSTTDGGHGYGLYIVREYSTLLGGRVEVSSQVGRGSSFHLYLPVPSLQIRPVQQSAAVQAS